MVVYFVKFAADLLTSLPMKENLFAFGKVTGKSMLGLIVVTITSVSVSVCLCF